LIDKDNIVSTRKISEIFGYDPRRIQQLTHEGAFVKVAHGKYDLAQSIHSYIEYRVGKNKPKDDDEIDNNVETALWTRARKEKTELEVKIIKGELHRSQDVKRVMNDMLTAFRQRVLALPTKMAPQLLMKDDVAVLKDLLEKAAFEMLNELKDYDPNVFYELSSDKMFLEEDEVSDDIERGI
jgi:phage terminase Nu1 subunit (DNA packaging protein)